MSSEIREPKSWNVMVYLAGQNNLAEECIHALKEMKRARPREGSERSIGKRVKVIAQLDASGLGGRESRYILDGNDVDGKLEDCRIARRDTSETTYRSVLRDFISTSILENEGDGLARNYMLVLSGHGGGIINDDFLPRDVERPDTLSIPKIQWVLAQVRADVAEFRARPNPVATDGQDTPFRVNVLGLDSCLMSMAEIGYELREYADIMVGAEGYEPNTGWPFERVLTEVLSAHDRLDPQGLAETIVAKYVTYYSDFLPAGRSVDLAAIDLKVMRKPEFREAMRQLSEVLSAKLDEPEAMRHILLAHWEAQSYKEDQYTDLYDFCALLGYKGRGGPSGEAGSAMLDGAAVDEKIVGACEAVMKILKGKDCPAILKSCFSGPAVQHSHGLSVYFPWSNVLETYRELEFARDTGWHDFLQRYVEKTRRPKRPCLQDPAAKVETSSLFFNLKASGFDFLPSEDKEVPFISRILRNRVGTMKNPPLEYTICTCPDPTRADGAAAAAEGMERSAAAPAHAASVSPAKKQAGAKRRGGRKSAAKS